MSKTTKIIQRVLIGLLALVVLFIIYYFPVIDRLILRPCYHYPNMFIDCQMVE